jgi:hypothetical protein
MMGPLLTFDKSFLEMITAEEMDELDLNFSIFVTPTLVSEIIADLKHPAPRNGRLPEEIVRSLARKMVEGYGLSQMHFRPLALADLNQRSVPMHGQVVVDSSAPNVLVTEGGKGLVYDAVPELEMWQRWANGDFSEMERVHAQEWRSAVGRIDLPAIARYWEDFCGTYLPAARTIDEVISTLDKEIIENLNPAKQRIFLSLIFQFIDAPRESRFLSEILLRTGLLPKVRSWAPYAASIGRLGMVFGSCLSKKMISQRPTNVIDIEYLFYAPFAMVFVSQDTVHRQLWPAATTKASFVWGSEMKDDLNRLLVARKSGTYKMEGGRNLYYKQFRPEESVITRLRQKYMRFDPRDLPPPKAKTVEDLEPHIREHIREAHELLDNQRKRHPDGESS